MALEAAPNLWDFLEKCKSKLHKEAAEVRSDSEMTDFLSRWNDPQSGVLKRLKSKPFCVRAKPGAQRIFVQMMEGELQRVELDWKEIWRSLYESQ
jgi:hypothetical protein